MSADRIIMGHGGGGELSRRLLSEHILPRLSNPLLDPLMDSALLPRPGGRLCMTTDSFVVHPLSFPGADIGRLAICGTVNDLAVMGARPLALSLGLILEEGLRISTLERVLDSIAQAAQEAQVSIVTGDTKVIEHREGEGLMINTSGLGVLPSGLNLSPAQIQAGDLLLLSGIPAEHGLAVLSAREGLGFETGIQSDAAPLNSLIEAMLAAGEIHFLRDPTRGGVAGVLADLVEETGLGLEVEEGRIPMSSQVQHLSEALGLDTLNVANEGKLLAVLPPESAPAVLAACRAHPLGRRAALIGQMIAQTRPLAELITGIGRRRIQRPYGEDLPRIC